MGKSAQALFDFKARKPEELSLKKGERLSGVSKVSDDWCKGTNSDGKSGVFPKKYVVMLDKVIMTTVAKFKFEAKKADRISFAKGETIEVLAKVSDEWWIGRNARSKIGLMPASYVQEKSGGGGGGEKKSAGAKGGRMAANQSKGVFTSATLKDFPIQFKMPSASLPSLRIGATDDSDARQSRTEANDLLQQVADLL